MSDFGHIHCVFPCFLKVNISHNLVIDDNKGNQRHQEDFFVALRLPLHKKVGIVKC